MVRTSLTDPFKIADLHVGAGRLGIAMCPGKKGKSESDPLNPWSRDLDDDLDGLAYWGCRAVLTLMEDREMIAAGVARHQQLPLLAQGVLARKMNWYHIAIPPRMVPDMMALSGLEYIADEWKAFIHQGGRALIHCKGGLGRSGMVAAMMLTRWGEDPGRAIERVRHVRGPRAVETADQEKMVYFTHARQARRSDSGGA